MFRIYKTKKLSKKWKEYNDFYNEGGEGYNPHDADKWEHINEYVPSRRILGETYTYAEAETMLQRLVDSLPKHTDSKKIAGCKDCIRVFCSAMDKNAAEYLDR